jgi:hypothetical protein
MKFRFVLQEPDDEPNIPTPSPTRTTAPGRATLRYRRGKHGLLRLEKGGEKATALTNFNARIVSDFILDDGERERREFGIEAELGERKATFVLSAPEFARMDWVLNRLGPRAIIYPGQKQHARAAIQWLSREIRQEHIYTHLGWRKHGPHWLYLHAGGALGVGGSERGVEVRLPAAVESFRVRAPENNNEIADAIRSSLSFLAVAPDRISFPLLAAAYRAALGKVDFSVFLAGQTGTFKTAIAALCQQHFGASMDATNLPANFASTGNALEGIAFHTKDALLVVDDFAPAGGHADRDLDRVAERLFRAAGNRQGRSRLTGNVLSAPKRPRALVLATGEQVAPGRSIRARLLVVEVGPGEVDRTALSNCQRAGQEGQFTVAMGEYLKWIAGRYEELQERQTSRVQQIRREGRGRSIHARLPTALAELQSGWEIFLAFAVNAAAIGMKERQELEDRMERALAEVAERQAKYQLGSDPASMFICLLKTALSSGHAHVAERAGGTPQGNATVCGWRHEPNGQRFVPQGARIGWIDGEDLFLEPAISFKAAQALGGAETLQVSEQTLRRRLHDRGLLASIDPGREMLTVRRTLAGRPRQVLHLYTASLLSIPLLPPHQACANGGQLE